MWIFKTNKALRSVINALEDENKYLKQKRENLINDNFTLLNVNKELKKKINDLENENNKLKADNQSSKGDNLVLLDNAKELRAKINGLENILESYAEKEVEKNQPKRRGRPKKEAN